MKIIPRNWDRFQHYKDRDPPWIKLHKNLLDDFDFHCLPDASRALAPCLWLLASESKDGVIDADYARLAFRLRRTPEEIEAALSPLIGKGFFEVVQFDSTPLAERKPDAMPETETEAETKTPSSASPPRPKDPPAETAGFLAFWSAWPKSDRKADRTKCFDVWRRDRLDALTGDIVQHVELMRVSRKWRDGFEPAPLRYLRGKQWRDPVPAGRGERVGNGVAL